VARRIEMLARSLLEVLELLVHLEHAECVRIVAADQLALDEGRWLALRSRAWCSAAKIRARGR
jgi:hypothetical protein